MSEADRSGRIPAPPPARRPFSLQRWLCETPGKQTVLPAEGDIVLMLHGLGRTRWSLMPLARCLHAAGFHVVNADYPSLSADLAGLAADHVAPVLQRYDDGRRMHFVGHSLGCLVIRKLLRDFPPRRPGRAVLLAPPNRGSDIIERFGGTWLLRTILGPVTADLGTAPGNTAEQLGPALVPTGIIAGSHALIPCFRRWLGPESDGIVSLGRCRLDGMADFLVVKADHTFIMRRRVVARQVLSFLCTGTFDAPPAGGTGLRWSV